MAWMKRKELGRRAMFCHFVIVSLNMRSYIIVGQSWVRPGNGYIKTCSVHNPKKSIEVLNDKILYHHFFKVSSLHAIYISCSAHLHPPLPLCKPPSSTYFVSPRSTSYGISLILPHSSSSIALPVACT